MELKLLKVIPNQNWVSLEPSKGSKIQEAKAVSVTVVQPDTKAKPYASNKNLDKIDQDIKKDLEEEKPEGDGALNAP